MAHMTSAVRIREDVISVSPLIAVKPIPCGVTYPEVYLNAFAKVLTKHQCRANYFSLK